jgi:hypothetical protein
VSSTTQAGILKKAGPALGGEHDVQIHLAE